MVLTVKITVFWDVMPCNSLDNTYLLACMVSIPEDKNFCSDSRAKQKLAFIFLLYAIS